MTTNRSNLSKNRSDSKFGFSINTPPGSVRSHIKSSQSDQESPLVKYIKGYTLIFLGAVFIALTLLNILFGVGEGTLLLHYVSNLGIYVVGVLPIIYSFELGLKIFKHN